MQAETLEESYQGDDSYRDLLYVQEVLTHFIWYVTTKNGPRLLLQPDLDTYKKATFIIIAAKIKCARNLRKPQFFLVAWPLRGGGGTPGH